MWIRSAYWQGRALSGQETALKSFVQDELLPEMALMPGVLAAQAFWPERREHGAPDIVCQIVLRFHSRTDIDVMLASSQRERMRTNAFERLKSLFDGTVAHLDLELLEGQA
jgi:hypothetical protein